MDAEPQGDLWVRAMNLTLHGSPATFVAYGWGILVRPRATIDLLAAEPSVRWATIVVALSVVQVWGNMLLFAAFGFDWLGTRPMLPDPTYVGWFGYLRVSADQWVPVFAALMPVLALYGLTIAPAVAQLMSKLWGGQGTFEQMVNVLVFATVPSLVIGWLSEWLTGVSLNLLTGAEYFYAAAMHGAYGTAVARLWTGYALAVYTIPWVWGIALGIVGIRRVQRIPWPAATVTMLVAYGLHLFVEASFVR
jgi:hypothetical protein